MQGVTCSDNEVCQLVQVQCIRAPCPPMPQCVPRTGSLHLYSMIRQVWTDFQIKIIGKHLLKATFNQTEQCVLALPWKIWSDSVSRQRRTYMYVFLLNQWIATNTTGSYCLEIVKRVVSRIIFSLYARNVCLQSPGRTKISDVDELKRLARSEARCLLNGRRRGARVYALVFMLEVDISSMWCKDDVTY